MSGTSNTDQMTRGLTQPWENTVAKSTRLTSRDAEETNERIGAALDVDRTGGSVEELEMVTESENAASEVPNVESSAFTGSDAQLDATKDPAVDNMVVGDIVRTGDPMEYSAGKAARSVITSTFHFVNEFVLGLTGYSLYFWGGLALAIFVAVELAKRGVFNKILPSSNLQTNENGANMKQAGDSKQGQEIAGILNALREYGMDEQ